MQKVTTLIKRIFSKDLQTLYKAGLIDDRGSATAEGKLALGDILFQTYQKELVARAEELIAEEKAEKNDR